MARFAVASKALRGPFKKLIAKLELTLRKPAIKKLGRVGRRVAGHFRSKDEATAVRAAQDEAARLRAAEMKPPTAVSAAVDRNTGQVVAVGRSKHSTPVPADLLAKLPDPPIEKRWAVTNCGEVDVASQAMGSGSKLEDLVIRTVHAKDGTIYPPCDNCEYWVPREG
jgi:hypothetical protein